METVIFKNNATSTLQNDTLAGSTSLQIAVGEGSKFPSPGVDEYFMVTIEDRRTRQLEICKCTARVADILTVVRAREATSAQDFLAGATVSNRLTAGVISLISGDTKIQPSPKVVTDLATVNGGAPVDNQVVLLQGYFNALDGGGGTLFYDAAADQGTANTGNRLSAFPAPGLWRRPDDGAWHSLYFGINHAGGGSAAQNVDRLHDMIRECQLGTGSRELVIDPGSIQCGGAEIWFNPTADPFCSSSGRSFTVRGSLRRDSRLLGANVTFGKFYRIDPVSGLAVPDITRDPCGPSRIDNLHIEGCTRLVNHEGSPLAIGCSFFASANAGFYTTPPANWGLGDAISRTITTPYSAYMAVVEAIACNHFTFFDNNIQNGRPYGLDGMICSQMGNIHVLEGIVANNKKGINFNAHPVYGIRSSETIEVLGTHFESNTEECLFLAGQGRADVKGHFRGSPGLWDRANHPLIRVETALSTHINIDGLFTGVDITNGTFITADTVSGIHIQGSFTRGKTIASFGSTVSGITFGRITRRQIGRGTEFLYTGTPKPYRQLPSVIEGLTPLAITRNNCSLVDDFLGVTLDPTKWILKHGANGVVNPTDFAITTPKAGGFAVGVTGSAGSGTMALNGISISSAQNYRADKDGLAAEVAINVSSAVGVVICVAFTDQVTALEMPITYSGTTPTPVATDAFGFIFDTNSTNDKWTMFGIANDVAVSKETTTAASPTTQRLRISADTDGIANYYINGVLQGITELITNGDFNDATTWNFSPSSWVWDGTLLAGQHILGDTNDMSQPQALVAGQTYTVSYTIGGTTPHSTGTVTPSFKGGTPVVGAPATAAFPYTFDLVAGAGNNLLAFTPTADFEGYITSVSVQQKGLTGAVRPSIPLALVVATFSYILNSPRTIEIDEIAIIEDR